jgi:single-stranded DNA-binding protein
VNNLNSILIEGKVFGELETWGETGKWDFTACFTIKSVRHYKHGDEIRKEENLVDIETEGKLAESILNHVSDGRGVRVVGRLRSIPDSKAVIVAEHIEVRPEIKNNATPLDAYKDMCESK